MERNKENTIADFMSMIKKSWTYDKMTNNERGLFMDSVIWANEQNIIKGDYRTRWDILQGLYYTFLTAIGYSGSKWREPNPDEIPFTCGE